MPTTNTPSPSNTGPRPLPGIPNTVIIIDRVALTIPTVGAVAGIAVGVVFIILVIVAVVVVVVAVVIPKRKTNYTAGKVVTMLGCFMFKQS